MDIKQEKFIKELDIINFKNLHNFSLQNIGRLNLIVGVNNVGKSSLLEAISIIISKGSMEWLKILLENRGLPLRNYYDNDINENDILNVLSSLFYRNNREGIKDSSFIIKAIFDSFERIVKIRIVDLMEIKESDARFPVYRLKENSLFDDQMIFQNIIPGIEISVDAESKVYTFNAFVKAPTWNFKSKSIVYIKSDEYVNNLNPELFDKISLTDSEKYLIEALKIIEPSIKNINFLKPYYYTGRNSADNRIPYVVFEGATDKIPLSTMGDGINRILTLILAIINCKDGCLLIDEFENGLHYSVQDKLWTIINTLSKKLNVQVFATTHSEDCIKSFLQASSNNSDRRLIRIQKFENQIFSVVYNEKDELNFIMNNNIETR